MKAYRHVEFLRHDPNIFSRPQDQQAVENVIYIIGDNSIFKVSVLFSERIAEDLNVPLIGCACHIFNLEMQTFC